MRPILLSRLPEPLARTLAHRLECGGATTLAAPDDEALLDAVLDANPCVLVHVLRSDPAPDLSMLRIVRRAAPTLPLILLAERGSLETQREIVDLRPSFYDVLPVEEDIVVAAIDAVSCRPAAGARERHTENAAGGAAGRGVGPRVTEE